MALNNLNLSNKDKILFVGDDSIDIEAAYAAKIKPIFPSWIQKKEINVAPAAILSTENLLNEYDFFDHIELIADRCARYNSYEIDKKYLYFMPLDLDGNIICKKKYNIDIVCFGRYFSQKSEFTALLHEDHALSQEIVKKELSQSYVLPEYFVDLINQCVDKIPEYLSKEISSFDIVTVIPAKKGKNTRLENLLNRVKSKSKSTANFIADLFYFAPESQSLKTLGSRENRAHEIRKNLKIKEKYLSLIKDKNILIIDDVITTGSTFRGAFDLLENHIPNKTIGVCFAKTVSFQKSIKHCPSCDRLMRLQKNSKNGIHFWACTGYYEKINVCKHTEPLVVKICPKCGGNLIKKFCSSRKEYFIGCSEYSTSKCFHTESI